MTGTASLMALLLHDTPPPAAARQPATRRHTSLISCDPIEVAPDTARRSAPQTDRSARRTSPPAASPARDDRFRRACARSGRLDAAVAERDRHARRLAVRVGGRRGCILRHEDAPRERRQRPDRRRRARRRRSAARARARSVRATSIGIEKRQPKGVRDRLAAPRVAAMKKVCHVDPLDRDPARAAMPSRLASSSARSSAPCA